MVLTPPGEPVEAPRPTRAARQDSVMGKPVESPSGDRIDERHDSSDWRSQCRIHGKLRLHCSDRGGWYRCPARATRGLGMAVEDFEPDLTVSPEAKAFDDRPARSALLDAKLHRRMRSGRDRMDGHLGRSVRRRSDRRASSKPPFPARDARVQLRCCMWRPRWQPETQPDFPVHSSLPRSPGSPFSKLMVRMGQSPSY